MIVVFLNKAIQNTEYIEWKYYWYDLFLTLFGNFGLDHGLDPLKCTRYLVKCFYEIFSCISWNFLSLPFSFNLLFVSISNFFLVISIWIGIRIPRKKFYVFIISFRIIFWIFFSNTWTRLQEYISKSVIWHIPWSLYFWKFY